MANRIFVILVFVCLLANFASAQFEIISNPYNLNIEAINDYGVEGWPYWDSDTFEQEFNSGNAEVYLHPAGVAWGDVGALVDGDAASPGVIMYDTWSAMFRFKQEYAGPRTLGNAGGWGHAIRIGLSDHEDTNRYRLEVLYTTDYDPDTLRVLFEIQDLDPDKEWAPYAVVVHSDAVTATIRDIQSVYVRSYAVEQQSGNVGGVLLKEFNVNFVDSSSYFVSDDSVLSGNDSGVLSPAWLNPEDVSFTETGATYGWVAGDMAGLGNDSGSLQSNTGSWEQDGAVWSSWDAQDSVFEFDLKKSYLINKFKLACDFTGVFDGSVYERGLGRLSVYLSEDGIDYSLWGEWFDDSEPNIPKIEAHRFVEIDNYATGARYVRCEVSRNGRAGIYHQMVIDEAVVMGQEMPISVAVLSGNANVASPAWVNPLDVDIVDSGATYRWIAGDLESFGADTTVLQSNTGSWDDGGAVWGTWDGPDTSIFEFDLKKQSLITRCSLVARFSESLSGSKYNEGIGCVDIYLSVDGDSFYKWATWVDNDPNFSPAGQNTHYWVELEGPAAKSRYVRYVFSKSGGDHAYHQAVLDEAIIWGCEYVFEGDLDGDDDVDDSDLNVLANNWLTDTRGDVVSDRIVDDFESYTGLLSGDKPLAGSWMDVVWATGMSEFAVEQSQVFSGSQSLKWTYTVADSEQYSEIMMGLGSIVDLSNYDELQIKVMRQNGNLPMGLLYVKFLDGGTTENDVAAEFWISKIQGSTYFPAGIWSDITVDLRELIYSFSAKGYTNLDELTAVRGILIGTCSGESDGSGVIYIDDIKLIDRCEISIADITEDCLVDFNDFAKLANDWLEVVE